MPSAAEAMAAVRRRFSHAGAAGRWDAMYATETARLDEANFRLRRDIAVARVRSIVTPESLVLDLGCGTGPVISELRRHGVKVVGLDYSDDMLAHARARLRALGLDEAGLMRGDCRETPYPRASFDVVVCLGVISYIENYAEVLEEIHRLLKPGGTALISFRNAFNPILSDPVALGKLALRTVLRPLVGPRAPKKFAIGRFLDHREVAAKIDALGFRYVDFYGIGFGPFRLGGMNLFSERQSIRISRWLTGICGSLSMRRPLHWLTDVSLWVWQKPS